MKTPKQVKEIEVEVGKKALTVEKWFRRLSDGNQMRIATDCLVRFASDKKRDYHLITNHPDVPEAEFTISVKLTNVDN